MTCMNLTLKLCSTYLILPSVYHSTWRWIVLQYILEIFYKLLTSILYHFYLMSELMFNCLGLQISESSEKSWSLKWHFQILSALSKNTINWSSKFLIILRFISQLSMRNLFKVISPSNVTRGTSRNLASVCFPHFWMFSYKTNKCIFLLIKHSECSFGQCFELLLSSFFPPFAGANLLFCWVGGCRNVHHFTCFHLSAVSARYKWKVAP